MVMTRRSYVSRYFTMELNKGEPAGYLKSVDIGGIKGELIAQQIGGQPQRIKHIANPQVEPVTVQVGMSMSKQFWNWVKKSWNGEVERRNGSIVVYDYKMQPMNEYKFQEALILETTIPTLDAASKEGAYMTVKFQPETATYVTSPSGSRIQAKIPPEQKLWHPSNFRLEIGDHDCTHVAKIDSFTVKQNVKPMACGSDWMYQMEPTSLEIPNLSIYMPMAYADDFFKWHEDFVINGNNTPDKELTGSITFLDSPRTSDLLTINLMNVGIVNIVPEKLDVSQEQIRKVKIELYCEEMDFAYEG